MTEQYQLDEALARLRNLIEEKVGRKMKTPKDFDFLAEQIFDKLHESVSATTLKRIWGYLTEPSTPRLSTLDLLAQFIDYKDWDSFCHQDSSRQPVPSPVSTTPSLKSRRLLIPLAVLVIALLVGGSIFALSSYSERQKDTGEFMDDYYLKRGAHFDKPQDYLKLFGIYDLDFYWGREVYNHPGIFIWGPEYDNPTYGNKGDAAAMMPTITERWTSDNVSPEQIAQRNSDLYYVALHRNEIRLTFMKNLVDSGYVFLGVYRLSKTESDTTHTTWERVQDNVYLHDLHDLLKYCN
jgi:hypothetical protein